MKEVDSDESGNDAPPEESEDEMSDDDEDDEEEEVAPAGKAYGALLASLKRPEEDEGRSRKRRKLEAPAEVPMVAEESGDESNAEPGLEVDEASDDGDEHDDEEAMELAAAADASSETLQDDD